MSNPDVIRVRHMLEAVRDAMAFAEGESRSSLNSDRMLLLSLVKCVEIVGEAASKVTPECRRASPAIPWAAIVTMRHRLVHGYFDINRDILWQTIQEDLPQLAADLERILADFPD